LNDQKPRKDDSEMSNYTLELFHEECS
jgi:hypothetical protein